MHTHPQEDHFEARALLAGQSEELDALREQARYICTATYAYAYAYAYACAYAYGYAYAYAYTAVHMYRRSSTPCASRPNLNVMHDMILGVGVG